MQAVIKKEIDTSIASENTVDFTLILPPEVLKIIFKFASKERHLATYREICKLINDLMIDMQFRPRKIFKLITSNYPMLASRYVDSYKKMAPYNELIKKIKSNEAVTCYDYYCYAITIDDITRLSITELDKAILEINSKHPNTSIVFTLDKSFSLECIKMALLPNFRSELIKFLEKSVISNTYINLAGADLSYTCLPLRHFEHANLSNVNFSNALLKDAYFDYANLSNANLTNANLIRTSFKKANLESANFSNAELFDLKGEYWDHMNSFMLTHNLKSIASRTPMTPAIKLRIAKELCELLINQTLSEPETIIEYIDYTTHFLEQYEPKEQKSFFNRLFSFFAPSPITHGKVLADFRNEISNRKSYSIF